MGRGREGLALGSSGIIQDKLILDFSEIVNRESYIVENEPFDEIDGPPRS